MGRFLKSCLEILDPWKKSCDKPRQHIKKQRHHFASKAFELQSRRIFIGKESLGQQGDQISQFYRNSTLNIHWKDWCWSWSSNSLATWCKELTHWKRPWCCKDWGQEEKGVTKDEMVGWHHWLNVYESEQTLGDNEGQGSLACCSSWGKKEWGLSD